MIKPASYQKGGSATAETKEFGNHIIADRLILRDYDNEVEKDLLKTVPSVYHEAKVKKTRLEIFS